MSPKKALIILLFSAVAIALFFVFVYFYDKQGAPTRQMTTVETTSSQERKQTAENQEQKIKQQEDLVNKKIEEKRARLEAKSGEVIQKQGYTQEELEFIANPKAAVERELGIEPDQPAGKVKPYTQAELEAIANPRQ